MLLRKINVKDLKRRFIKMSIEIKAPMTGKIVMDAMKMEIPIYAPAEGTVKEINVKEGDSVKTDQVLMTLD
jgi:acetyl-CoA carboxylase biotin carboxyl carrier protein